MVVHHLPVQAGSKFLSLSIFSVMVTGFYKTSVHLPTTNFQVNKLDIV